MLTAQPLASTGMPLSGLNVANVHAASLGDLTAGGTDIDFCEFELLGDGLVTMEVLSKEIYAEGVETIVSIFDDAGTLLYLGDDLSYDPVMMICSSTLFDGLTEGLQDDPLVLHMPLTAGTYFVSVAIDMVMHSPDPMSMPLFYDLFITAEARFVPEPSGLVLSVMAMGILGGSARKR